MRVAPSLISADFSRLGEELGNIRALGLDAVHLDVMDGAFVPNMTFVQVLMIRSGNTALTPEDDDALTDYLWPVVCEIIKTAVENKQNLIIEGCYIPPDWRKHLDERYLPFIRFICLAMTEEYIERHFDEIIAHESEIESRLTKADCTPEELKKCNRWFMDTFGGAGERIVLISDDYDRVLENLID